MHVAAPAFVSRQVPSVKSCPWTSAPCCSCRTRGAAVGAGCHRRPSTDGSVVTTGRPEVGSPRGRPIDRTAVWCSRRRRRVLGVAPASCTRDVGCHCRSSAGGCRVAGADLSVVCTVTWLILPVVICLSQRLSHACLSMNASYCETANGSLNQL